MRPRLNPIQIVMIIAGLTCVVWFFFASESAFETRRRTERNTRIRQEDNVHRFNAIEFGMSTEQVDELIGWLGKSDDQSQWPNTVGQVPGLENGFVAAES